MEDNISSLIAFCNNSILVWYKKVLPKEIGEFTPVDENDETIVNTIYQMYLIVKANTNVQLLLPVVKYYFAVSVVEYYVLQHMGNFFNNRVLTKYMVEFSKNNELSIYRKKMMGFNTQPYMVWTIKSPYKINLPVTCTFLKCAIS